MTDDPVKKKEEFVTEISEAKSEAARLEALGQEIARVGRYVQDVAGPMGDLVSALPAETLSAEVWERETQGWRAFRVAAGKVEKYRTVVSSLSATSLAATSTSTGMLVTIATSITPPSPKVQSATSQLHEALASLPLADRAHASMRRLGLDRGATGRRAPLDLLEEARGALERPAVQQGGAPSTLLTLRESINGAMTDLLRRRAKQEPAGKDSEKVVSIGRQCGRDGLDPGYFDRLAAQAGPLLDELSGSKNAEMPREQVTRLFNRGVLFLVALLEGINETRLR